MKPYNILFIIFLGFSVIITAGCAPMEKVVNPYDEDFNCKAPSDTGKCVDTPTAYLMARYPSPADDPDKYLDDGVRITATGNQVTGNNQATTTPQSRIIVHPTLTVEDQRYKDISQILQQPKKPILAPPKILRVLLLPYTGEGDELFMTRFVYVQVEKSKWILSDIEEK